MTYRPLVLALAVAFSHGLCHSTFAQTVLDTVSVAADALRDDTDETATLTTLDATRLSESMVANIKDAVRYEPGISVTNNASRFGLAGFNIRGVEDNRVLMQIDGVRLPEAFKIGGYANVGRNLVDIALLKRIDIQRGSASALYGSGALGGAVGYITPDPEDWLNDGRTLGGGLELQYHSANDGKALIPTLAVGSDTVKLLLRGVRRSGSETESKGTLDVIGTQRTVANPQDDDTLSGLVKMVFTPNTSLRTALTLEGFDRAVDTHHLSSVRGPIVDVRTEDRYNRKRVSFDQRVSGLALGTLDLKLYKQTNLTTQDTFERRRYTPTLFSLVDRNMEQQQDIVGLRLAFDTLLEAQGAHNLNWGVEVSRRDTIQMRDGQEFFPTLNLLEKEIAGITYPARDYPPSTIDELGVFAQDTWMLSEQWSFLIGLRYDRYKLKPEPDALYTAANPTAIAAPVTTDSFSPKLGAIWRFAPGFELSGQYAWGFRAPPFDDVNIGFTNPGAYITIPNPKLESEVSRGPEISLRQRHAQGHWHLTAFDTRYRNFIETEALDCPRAPGPPGVLGPLLPTANPLCSPSEVDTFQAINLDGVRIYGMEAGFGHALSPAWTIRGGLAWAHGRDADANPIDSVNPLTATLGLIYDKAAWKLETSLSMARGKSGKDARRNASGAVQRLYLSDGYAIVDVRGHWRFARHGRISIGMLNLFDTRYSHWSDVPVRDVHIADSSFGPDRYSQPGRNFTFSLAYDFK